MKLTCLLFALMINFAEASLIGGWRVQDVSNLNENTDSELLPAAHKAVELMNNVKTQNGAINSIPIVFKQILSAETQIVAGVNYRLTLKLEIDGAVKICDVVVSHLIGLNGWEWLLSVPSPDDHCARFVQKSRKRRSAALFGAERTAGLNDKNVQKAAAWAVDHYNRMSNSMFKQSLVKVSQATKQVVSGFRYRFLLTMAETACRNNEESLKKSALECPVSDAASARDCDVSVILKQDTFTMEEFNCKKSKLNQLIGGGDHDYKPHGMIGGGDHDYKPHGLLGGGDHDYKPHGMIGGGDHDYKPHGMIGGGDHDYKPHGMIGGGDHDYKPHGMIGGGDHDYKPHGMIGGGDHDYKPHGMIGGGDHDYKPHGSPLKFEKSEPVSNIHVMSIPEDKPAGAVDSCQQYLPQFQEFKTNYNRLYGTEEEESTRFQVFCKNMERIQQVQKAEMGSGKYGITQFADLSEEEFKKNYLGFKTPATVRQLPKAEIPTDPIPDAWDWRDHGAVTPVKNQGSCGSCWAFSVTGNIEGQWAIKSPSHQLLSLSEQELVDCDKIDEGCNGGFPSQAYEALMELGGIETEGDYKYEGKDDKCRLNKSEIVVKLTGSVNISRDETEMAAWLYKNGPISIGINAFAMQFYMGGISHPWKMFCDPNSLDHGVLIVGYGMKGKEPFWIVKNSWGTHWGVKGYYLVYRGDGTCGLNTMCTSATVN